MHSWVRRQVERLAALGMLTVRDVEYEPDESEFTETEGGLAELTPAGVPVAVRLAEDLGITVLAQPDPATATAADIVEPVGRIPLEEWQADAAAWVQRRDGGEAARTTSSRPSAVVTRPSRSRCSRSSGGSRARHRTDPGDDRRAPSRPWRREDGRRPPRPYASGCHRAIVRGRFRGDP